VSHSRRSNRAVNYQPLMWKIPVCGFGTFLKRQPLTYLSADYEVGRINRLAKGRGQTLMNAERAGQR